MTMEQRRLGTTGVWVSELCLGTMMFGEWGTKDHDESIRIIHRALDAGITFVDTADVYSAGESEIIVGKALTGGTPVSEPGQQGVVGELAETLPVTGEGDAPAGQVDVVQGEFADGLGAGGVHGC